MSNSRDRNYLTVHFDPRRPSSGKIGAAKYKPKFLTRNDAANASNNSVTQVELNPKFWK